MWILRRSRRWAECRTPPEPNAASNKISLDVHVTSSPQLDFQNTFAKLVGARSI
jgi:hypothetical protein